MELLKLIQMANRNQPINANAETKEQADQFITTLGEMFEIIDQRLPVELRQSYLQMREGISITKAKKLQLETYIKDILSEWRQNG